MAQLKVIFLLVAITAAAYSVVTINAKPLDNDGAEIVMKIERINEQLPGVQAKLKDETQDDGKKKKTQRNYPVYYVNTKVNGKFGKNVRAFTSEEFVEQYPVRY